MAKGKSEVNSVSLVVTGIALLIMGVPTVFMVRSCSAYRDEVRPPLFVGQTRSAPTPPPDAARPSPLPARTQR